MELLTEIVPGLAHVALIFNPQTYTGQQTPSIEAAAPALRVRLTSLAFREGTEIDRALTEFSREANGGLLVLPDSSTVVHRELIVGLAARQRIPAIYPFRSFITSGGLAYYGTNLRISIGWPPSTLTVFSEELKPADLPVQAPTKYELSLTSRPRRRSASKFRRLLLARADEVIE